MLLEIGNALAKLRYRTASVQLLTALEIDPNVEIVSLTDDLYIRAFQLYQSRLDKEWGLTDCISFVVMQERGLTAALRQINTFSKRAIRRSSVMRRRVDSGGQACFLMSAGQ